MRSKYLNENSSNYVVDDGFDELAGVKKVFTYRGSLEEAFLDSATTAYADNDVIANCGALDVTVPAGHEAATKILIEKIVFMPSTAAGATCVGNINAGTASTDALNAAITGQVELFGAGATYRNANLAADLSITEVDADFNGSTIQWAQPLIILPVATNNIYVGVTTTINHATNFDAGRYQFSIEYTVL
tara:strand:- start:63 stop:629 length:567 start_codon:yes stop_codon:yes gene_type:complete